ncbi:MAG: fibronectin type III domain-containing protein [Anaerolineae bacterium]|jgi:N-acetylmuramoyl-L-alanine amidase
MTSSKRCTRLLLLLLLGFAFLTLFSRSVTAQGPPPICFWSDQGPAAVERAVEIGAAGLPDAEGLLTALLAGPTPQEEARGIWSAIPEGTTLEGVEVQLDRTTVVRLRVPSDALRDLDHGVFEIIVNQIRWTLESMNWRDLRIQTWDPLAEEFVPLATFLPEIEPPRKETVLSGEEAEAISATYVGQPPAPGQGQPQGSLSGKTVYISAGHGWEWTGSAWRTQRPPYPNAPYIGPIIEDHNNAEAVNQYLLQYLWNAGATVIPVRERDMNSTERIVNNDDGTGYDEEGSWMTSSQAGYDLDSSGTFRYASAVTGTATATATWAATLPSDGRYAVYVWYRPGSDRVPDAHYTVYHTGGETTVTVDQQHHGITWHYIGTYGFRGGEVATVTLNNLSSQPGKYVIADAVRFGGGTFDSLYGIETTAPDPPYKPWWEVCTFYYAQRMGMDQPPNDVVARPLYTRWEHAGTGDDAVYVSWHTNGYSGYQWDYRGTMSIIHNGHGSPITPGSADLRDAIHDELVGDIRSGWDPTWPEYKRSMNLGELRELWDSGFALDDQIPGTLIEIAYHDHPDDTDALKEPTFEMLAARALYQGIVKYFAQRDGLDLPLLPEPPTHLAVENVGGERVRLSWRPSPTDGVGLVGDAAAGYRVYTSTNGLGWSNGVPVTETTAYTLTGLSNDQLLFLRVTATNEGGESFPTETLAARVGDNAQVLLVNGFDRLNNTMLVPDYDPAAGYNLRMFLDQMNRYDYVIQHGEVISYPFDSASNEAISDAAISLSGYKLVDWILGEESAPDETLNAVERDLLETFLSSGGALFLSGAEVGWHLVDQGGDPDFYNNVLRADYVGDDAGTYEVEPVTGSIFDGLGSFRFDAPGMYDADYPDQITPANGSTEALAYYGGAGGTAAVQYDDEVTPCHRLVYFGFPFETILPQDRLPVMARVMDFLDLCVRPPVDTQIVSPVDGDAYNFVPDFEGTAEAGGEGVLDRVEVQIERAGDLHYWDSSQWVISPTWLTASGTSSWVYTLPVSLEDDDYRLQARAWTTGGVSDTWPAEATFTYDTLPPTNTTLITPTGGITIYAVTGVTLEWESVGPDSGSPLSYRLELDGQAYTTTQTSYTTDYIAEGAHTWRVQVFDAAGNYSDWVTDTFSIQQYESWLPLVMRSFELSTDVIVNGGFEINEGWILNQLAVYDPTNARSDARSARVGILDPDLNAYSYSSVRQTATLPAGSRATLSLWVYPVGDDPGDSHYVTMFDEGDAYHNLGTWAADTDSQIWQQREYDLSAYVGQTVDLYIGTKNDGNGGPAGMYIDDVSLKIWP